MRYTAAVAAAFVAGAVASYQPAYSPEYEAVDSMPEEHVAEPVYEEEHDDCDDDSYDCKMSSSMMKSSSVEVDPVDKSSSTMDEHTTYSDSMTVDPVPTSTHDEIVYVTDIVKHYETYCPHPTEVVVNEKTYTVTKATTLTIEDCNCPVTRPVVTSVVTECPEHECPTGTPSPVDTIKATDTVVVIPVHTSDVIPGPVNTDEPHVEEPHVEEPMVPVSPEEPHVEEPVVPVSPEEPHVEEPVSPIEPSVIGNGTVPVAPSGTGAAVPTGTVFEGAGSRITISGAGLAAVFAAVVYAL